jgi:hypothetical protein
MESRGDYIEGVISKIPDLNYKLNRDVRDKKDIVVS